MACNKFSGVKLRLSPRHWRMCVAPSWCIPSGQIASENKRPKFLLETLFPHRRSVFHSSAWRRWLLRAQNEHSRSSCLPCHATAQLIWQIYRPQQEWVTSACVQPGLTTWSCWNRVSAMACGQSVTIPAKFIYQLWQQPHHPHYDQCCKKRSGPLRWAVERWLCYCLRPYYVGHLRPK